MNSITALFSTRAATIWRSGLRSKRPARQGKRIKNALQTEGKRLSLGFLSGESDDGQFRRAFLGVTRPRIERKKLHALMDILVLTCLVRWSAERKAGRELRSLGPAQAGVAAVIHSPEKRCAFP